MPVAESVADDTVRDLSGAVASDTVVAKAAPFDTAVAEAASVRRIDRAEHPPRAALLRLAEEVRRRRKGAGASDAHECTVVAVTALTLDGRRTGKSFLARVLYVSTTGLAVLLDRPAPATAFVVEWDDVPPMTFDLALSRRMRGRFEAALVLREESPTSGAAGMVGAAPCFRALGEPVAPENEDGLARHTIPSEKDA
jgi:hypothetical protein